MKSILIFLAAICVSLVPIGSSLRAEWAENGVLVDGGSNPQTEQVIVPDGSGGCFITWASKIWVGPSPVKGGLPSSISKSITPRA